jgi:hypothetical protein
MKLVREHINEKFEEDGDPIQDMGIGLIKKVNKWINENDHFFRVYDNSAVKQYDKCKQQILKRSRIKINEDDLTIDVDGWVDISDKFETLPEYIRFGVIKGDFACCFDFDKYQKFMPKQVDGEIRYYIENYYINIQYAKQIRENIKKVCKVKNIKIIKG